MPDFRKRLATLHTPLRLYSASKAIRASVIHELDEQRVLCREDRVCDYIPHGLGPPLEYYGRRECCGGGATE